MNANDKKKELKGALARKGLTHRALAEAMRMRGHRFDSYDVARIIAGRWQPSDEIKADIAVVLGKPTFELFFVEEE